MEFATIPAGVFWMGSPEDEAGRDDDETGHLVKLKHPFEMAVTPVTPETPGQWKAVMGTGLWSEAQKMLADDTNYKVASGEKTLRELFGLARDAGRGGVIGGEAVDLSHVLRELG